TRVEREVLRHRQHGHGAAQDAPASTDRQAGAGAGHDGIDGLGPSCYFLAPSRGIKFRGVAQPGRAPGSGPGGRRFKSCLPDQLTTLSERRAARRLSQRVPAALRAQRDDPVIRRRDLLKLAAVAALPAPAARRSGGYDVVVIGAGVFGAWTAWHLQRAGRRVVIVDAYGPANARASSGGESRVIRLGYGKDEIYTRMALASLRFWGDLSRRATLPVLHRIGVLELIGRDDRYARESREAIRRAGGRVEELSRSELAKRYPQISLEGITAGQLEPASGAVMARRAVLTLVQEMVAAGATYLQAAVAPPAGNGRLTAVRLRDGRALQAGAFAFACGPWLPRVFPQVLRDRIQ